MTQVVATRLAVGACALAALVAAAVAWSLPHSMSDYYLALAGGRDVLAGKLGKPDDWSFLAQGRVWIHQNWGADGVIYLVESHFGDSGILILKAVLISLALGCAAGAARARGASPGWAWLVAAWALLAWPVGAIIRANLFSFMLTPLLLWILARSLSRPRWIWAAPVLTTLWLNLHGSFVLGLGITGLWALCRVAAADGGIGQRWRRHRSEVLAAGAGVLLAAVASPFGVRALAVPFTVGPHTAWSRVHEWLPLFGEREPDENPWTFVVFAAATAAVFLLGKPGRAPRNPRDRSPVWFDVLLAATLITMAFLSRRFVLVATLGLTPVLAPRLDRMTGERRRAAAQAAGAVILTVVGLVPARGIPAFYRASHPRTGSVTFLDKMVWEHLVFATNTAGRPTSGGTARPSRSTWGVALIRSTPRKIATSGNAWCGIPNPRAVFAPGGSTSWSSGRAPSTAVLSLPSCAIPTPVGPTSTSTIWRSSWPTPPRPTGGIWRTGRRRGTSVTPTRPRRC